MAPTSTIPVIDINASHLSRSEIARSLAEAAIEHGFVYIRNNSDIDIPASDIDAAFDLSKKLFVGTSVEEKQKCAIGTNNRGWSGMHSETLDPKNQRVGDFKEAFNFGPFPTPTTPSQSLPPTIHPALTPQISLFRTKCHTLCLRLLHLFGEGLEVSPPSYFADSHDPARESGTILRHLYYPPVIKSSPAAAAAAAAENDGSSEEGGNDIRAGAHSDYGSVTLLFRLRGQPGLEVLTRSNEWVPVPVAPEGTENDPSPPILVNIGDLLSYWTGGLLRSTVHRVVFPSSSSSSSSSSTTTSTSSPSSATNGNGTATVAGETDTSSPRYSIAFFCHPAGDTELGAVPSERVKKHVSAREGRGKAEVGGPGVKNPYAERRVVTADEHLQMRLRASYLALYNADETA
ncbi:2OG-Fe(II) oxygenase superfamily protein [Zalerion maritima]|uniref:2OG-Fe(II) oxygenase superfamily protein n=1 Tax=Zalerion maritima TaxID=339359 RepID=A0AAD5RUV8_9PEZI|nr:2OG-Fe(II) oxygenase superfamily protein [Zalerion maritima]